MNLSDLKKPFAPDKVSWRVGSTTGDKSKGMALAYVDARDVQDRLDEVCGQDGWQCRYVPMHDKKTVCEIGIRVFTYGSPELDDKGAWKAPAPFEWIWKSDGAGDSDIEAEKGALSDSFKRAAVRWGIGRYLYDLDSPWVELDTYEKQGKVFAKGIKASERKRLEALLAKDATSPTQKHQEAQTPVPVPGGPPKMTPKQWGLDTLDTVRSLKGPELDAFVEKNTLALVKLRGAEPDLHRDILALVQLKQAQNG